MNDILWCVHVRGPDDLQAVASYADAVRLSDGLNWWWQALPLTEHDPIISAVPMVWDGTPEQHATSLAKLGARGADYALPTEAQVDAMLAKAVALRLAMVPAALAASEGL